MMFLLAKMKASNKEISKNGNIPKFNFKPKSHYELGEKLNMLDFDLATKHQVLDLFLLKINLLS